MDLLLTPSTRSEIVLIMMRKLAGHFGFKAKSPEEWTAMVMDYDAFFSAYPENVFVKACMDYLHATDSQFLPRIGQLRLLCDESIEGKENFKKAITEAKYRQETLLQEVREREEWLKMKKGDGK